MAARKKKSTTRSGTNLESLSLYTFFLDRASESNSLRVALQAIGARVELHRDYYEDDVDDQLWLPEVGAQGVGNHLTRPIQRARKTSDKKRQRAGVLDRRGQQNGRQAAMVVSAMPRMLRILKATPAPFIARIYKPKRVELISTRFRAHSKLSA